MEQRLITLSKFLSYALRHRPEEVGLEMDPQGWVEVEDLLRAANSAGVGLTREDLLRVVAENDKQRFTLTPDCRRIRAAQGHSFDVALGLAPQKPPEILFHGTATRFLESILSAGLQPGSRQHVHLSLDEGTAWKVGQRHGRPVVLRVLALQMHQHGHHFFLSDNSVWLTAHVPPEFLANEPGGIDPPD